MHLKLSINGRLVYLFLRSKYFAHLIYSTIFPSLYYCSIIFELAILSVIFHIQTLLLICLFRINTRYHLRNHIIKIFIYCGSTFRLVQRIASEVLRLLLGHLKLRAGLVGVLLEEYGALSLHTLVQRYLVK